MGEWRDGFVEGVQADLEGRGPEPPKGRSAEFRRGFAAGRGSRAANAANPYVIKIV